MQIKKAERKAINIKIAITGPSGSGKTLSSLLLAKGLCPNGKILVIDTEDGSSNLYADHALTQDIDFDVIELDAPYLPSKYIQALNMGLKENYDVVIIDSITHEWDGEGGILDKKNQIDQRGGNSFTNWGKVSAEHKSFIASIVHAPLHVIATMRSKQDYVMETTSSGKSAPKKVGLAPVQREGAEYEFTTVFDIDINHNYVVSKDRTSLFDGHSGKITREIGDKIRMWLAGRPMKESSPVPTAVIYKIIDAITCDFEMDRYHTTAVLLNEHQEQKKEIWARLPENVKAWIKNNIDKEKENG